MSVDRLLPYNDEDIMEHELTPFSVHPSFKQVLIQDKETPIQPSTAPVISEYPYSEANPDTPKSNSEVTYFFREDHIPIVNLYDLSDIFAFQQLFLIGKILGESLHIKLIISKCSVEWKPSGDFNIVDLGNGFSPVKFANAMDRNRILQGQPWFVGGQIYYLQPWKRHFAPIKEKLNTVMLLVRLPHLSLEIWNNKVLRHIISPSGNLIKIDRNSEDVTEGLFGVLC